MPRYTAAYSGLIQRIEEIDALTKSADKVARTEPYVLASRRIDAMCRGGVVLLCSHIEGYFEDLAAVALERIALKRVSKTNLAKSFRYHVSRDLIAAIQESRDQERIVTHLDTLIDRDDHIWGPEDRYLSAIAESPFLDNFSTPKHKNIVGLIRRFGYTDFQRDLGRELASNYFACRNMVNQVVEQRNKIAHGDTVTTGTTTDLRNMVQLTKQYCRAADTVVADWFRSIRCIIR